MPPAASNPYATPAPRGEHTTFERHRRQGDCDDCDDHNCSNRDGKPQVKWCFEQFGLWPDGCGPMGGGGGFVLRERVSGAAGRPKVLKTHEDLPANPPL
jgi:hypothetical protein